MRRPWLPRLSGLIAGLFVGHAPVRLLAGPLLLGLASTAACKRHRFPAQLIAHAVWLYFRLPLSPA